MHSFRIYSFADINNSFSNNTISISNSKNHVEPKVKNKKKKRISWNNSQSVIFTYSTEEYDRTIDKDTILTNQIKKINNQLDADIFNKPLERNPTYIHQFITWRNSP